MSHIPVLWAGATGEPSPIFIKASLSPAPKGLKTPITIFLPSSQSINLYSPIMPRRTIAVCGSFYSDKGVWAAGGESTGSQPPLCLSASPPLTKCEEKQSLPATVWALGPGSDYKLPFKTTSASMSQSDAVFKDSL